MLNDCISLNNSTYQTLQYPSRPSLAPYFLSLCLLESRYIYRHIWDATIKQELTGKVCIYMYSIFEKACPIDAPPLTEVLSVSLLEKENLKSLPEGQTSESNSVGSLMPPLSHLTLIGHYIRFPLMWIYCVFVWLLAASEFNWRGV